MENKILYQLRVDLNEQAAKELISLKTINKCKGLIKLIKDENAELICQYEAFKMFVEECKKYKTTNTPLYRWTKDTIENEEKKKKYMKSFTLYINNNQLYDKKLADKLERKILLLKCDCILKVNKYDSDPKNNPQPPKKYL